MLQKSQTSFYLVRFILLLLLVEIKHNKVIVRQILGFCHIKHLCIVVREHYAYTFFHIVHVHRTHSHKLHTSAIKWNESSISSSSGSRKKRNLWNGHKTVVTFADNVLTLALLSLLHALSFSVALLPFTTFNRRPINGCRLLSWHCNNSYNKKKRRNIRL